MVRYSLEIVAALVVTIVFGLGLAESLTFDGASMYMPGAACAFAMAMGLVWLVRHLLSGRPTRADTASSGADAPEDSAMQSLSVKTRMIRTVMILVMAAIFTGLIKTVGLITMTFLFVLVGSKGLGAAWRPALIGATCFAITVYVVFGLFLQLPLPPEAVVSLIARGH